MITLEFTCRVCGGKGTVLADETAGEDMIATLKKMVVHKQCISKGRPSKVQRWRRYQEDREDYRATTADP